MSKHILPVCDRISPNLPMCLMLLAARRHPDYPLIVVANRDEYHDRPSVAMDCWADHPDVLAGRDLREGGTWLGITKSGKFCTVTNHRTDTVSDHSALSRGNLVRHYLVEGLDSESFRQFLTEKGDRYRPFNLAFGQGAELLAYSNQDKRFRDLSSGFHSISNGPMDCLWPRMSRGLCLLADLVSERSEVDVSALHALMRDRDASECEATDAENHSSSSLFILGDHYGTRATTCFLVGHDDMRIAETCYDESGQVTGRRDFTVEIHHAT